jgi:hypothetical protein
MLKSRVKISGEIIMDIWEADLQRFAYLFRDLLLLTPFGDEVEICPKDRPVVTNHEYIG